MSNEFSKYRDALRDCVRRWPELVWVHRFLQTSKPANVDSTYAQTFDFYDGRVAASDVFYDPASFSAALVRQVQSSRLRLVLVCHGESWDIDRDIVDVMCSRYDLDPRFVSQHFDYPDVKFERNCPRDISDAHKAADHDYYENKYEWKMGGSLLPPWSLQLDSHFRFAYRRECLSLKILREESGATRKASSLSVILVLTHLA
ncbi:MAG: hypothetical protein Q9162_001053 [Coniocarpon cinnabarinum]